MKKFFLTCALGALFTLNACSSTTPYVSVQQNEIKDATQKEESAQKDPDTERIVNNLNQIQYSLSKIMATRNKAVLEAELSDVLNHIDPQSLENEELIGAYEYLLNTLVRLKMTQSQRDALAIEIDRKRENVKWEAVSNIGNAILMTGANLSTGNVAGALVPLANMAIFTTLNIKKLQGEITTDSIVRSMALDDVELEAIDQERINLFVASARVLKDKGKVSLIQENEMKAFGELITMLDDSTKVNYVLNLLENDGYKSKFKDFLPYQHALIKAYFVKNDSSSYDKMKLSYDKSTKVASSIYNEQNPYARESARYMVIMAMQHLDSTSLKHYVEDLKHAYPQIPEDKIEFHFFAYPVYIVLNQMDEAKNSLEFLKRAGELTRESKWNYQYYCKLTDIGDKNFCRNADAVWNAIDSLDVAKMDSSTVHYGCFFREDYDANDTVDYQVLENPYEYEITNKNTGVVKNTLNFVKKGLEETKNGLVAAGNWLKSSYKTGFFTIDIIEKFVNGDKNGCLDTLNTNDASIRIAYNDKKTSLQIRTIIHIDNPIYTLKAHMYGDRADDKYNPKTKNGLVIEELKYKF